MEFKFDTWRRFLGEAAQHPRREEVLCPCPQEYACLSTIDDFVGRPPQKVIQDAIKCGRAEPGSRKRATQLLECSAITKKMAEIWSAYMKAYWESVEKIAPEEVADIKKTLAQGMAESKTSHSKEVYMIDTCEWLIFSAMNLGYHSDAPGGSFKRINQFVVGLEESIRDLCCCEKDLKSALVASSYSTAAVIMEKLLSGTSKAPKFKKWPQIKAAEKKRQEMEQQRSYKDLFNGKGSKSTSP